MANDRARLFENASGGSNGWLGVRFAGGGAGTTVQVTKDERTQLEELHFGSSYASSSEPRLHFGLGSSASADVLVEPLRGPSRRYVDLPGGRYYVLD